MAEAVALANQAEIVSRIKDFGLSAPSEQQISFIEALASGGNVVCTNVTSTIDQTSRGQAVQAYCAFVALLGERKERTLIVLDSDDAVEQVCRELGDLRVPYAKMSSGRHRPPKNILSSSRAIVAAAAGLLGAFDEGLIDGSGVGRIILDGCEREIISGKVEEILNLLHDLQQTQVVLIRKDPLLNISNFINKYLSGAKEVQLSSGASSQDVEEVQAPQQPLTALEDMVHGYVELPAELLAKPNILADLIEAEGYPTTAVFCNTPSDADLTDVMLRKRGITTRKLVGYVSPQRADSAIEALKSGEAVALVLTDIAAKNSNLTDIEMVINHSLHTDPEVYVSRSRVSRGGSPTKKVISLATPIDLTAFHYLKKNVTVQFLKIEAPPREQILKARLDNLVKRAQQKNLKADERISSLVAMILSDDRKEEMVALLVHNTFDVLPSAAGSSSREREDAPPRDNEWRDDRRGNRRDRRRGGRGGRDSYDEGGGERRDSWRNAEYSGADNSGGGESEDTRYSDEGGSEGGYGDSRGESRSEGRNGRAPYVPPAKEARLYIGHGSKDGVTTDSLLALVLEKGGIERDQIKRSILRPLYSFVDVPEEIAPGVIEKLEQATFKGDEKLFVKRATQISSPRPGAKDDSQEGAQEGLPVEDVAGEPTEISESAPSDELVS